MTDEEMVTVPRSDVYDPKGYLWRDQWKWAVERAEKAEARLADAWDTTEGTHHD